MFAFSLPAITANIVTALYNIIDRIVVGRGVSEMALGGLSLVMPIMTLTGVCALLFGQGAGNLISLRLGEGRKEEAQSAANHCFWLLIIVGAVITVVGLTFLDPIMSVLGAQEGSASLGYGRTFIRIIFIGAIVNMLSFGLSSIVRAQGFPKLSMAGMLIAVSLNTILVIIFIFELHWGVEGSAWATIISMGVGSAWYIAVCFNKIMPLRLTPFKFKFSLKSIGDISWFGSSSAIQQAAMAFVIIFLNSRISYYGVRELDSEFGGDLALSGMTIMHSVVMIIMMIVLGFSMGAQPILGYNYGAKKFTRVRETYKIAVLMASIVAVTGFLIMHIFTAQLVSLFAPDGSGPLVEFAIKTMKYATIGIPLMGFQIISSSMFVATGRPKTALILSMSRQVIFLIPLALILGELFGLMGVVTSSAFGDITSSILTAVFIGFEMRKLRSKELELQL